jgi:hypothetical protein
MDVNRRIEFDLTIRIVAVSVGDAISLPASRSVPYRFRGKGSAE